MKVCSLISQKQFTRFFQIWYVVFLGRRAPPQQLWHPSDKRLQRIGCVKIVFLLMCSCSLRMPRFLGLHDSLSCVLIKVVSFNVKWVLFKVKTGHNNLQDRWPLQVFCKCKKLYQAMFASKTVYLIVLKCV